MITYYNNQITLKNKNKIKNSFIFPAAVTLTTCAQPKTTPLHRKSSMFPFLFLQTGHAAHVVYLT